MALNISLKTRLFGGIIVVLLTVITGLAVGVHQFIEALEVALVEEQLNDRMEAFVVAYMSDPTNVAPPRSVWLKGYVSRTAADAAVPAWLARLSAGIHEDIEGEGRTWYVVRRDVSDARLYLTLDVGQLERLEAEFLVGALASVALAVVLAASAAWWLSRVILAPVSNLASRVTQLDPGQRGARVGVVSKDREVNLIAHAFDRYLDQLDAFVIREQAFTGDVSHELRTPLATVLSAAQLLLADAELPLVVRTRVERIERAAGRMHELTEAMLFLARDPGPTSIRVCALEQILGDVVDSYRELAQERRLDIRLLIQTRATIAAPPGMVTSVIGNLIGNAIDHASGGVVEVELVPGLLTVRDEGPGIAAGDVSHVFERGYKSRASRGFGLGLALVKRICDHLGWTLRIDSGVGRGTRVDVAFVAPRQAEA